MDDPHWLQPADPAGYARAVLHAEAPEIPDTLLSGTWSQVSLGLRELTVNETMVADHDSNPIHQQRRDRFVEAIGRGARLPPLITLGGEHHLVDGFARLRALRILGIDRVEVITNRDSPRDGAAPTG